MYHGIDRLYNVVVSGWGKTEGDSKLLLRWLRQYMYNYLFQGTSRSNWLQKVTLNETKLEDCKALYSKIKMNILDSQICAANYEGGDACQGKLQKKKCPKCINFHKSLS